MNTKELEYLADRLLEFFEEYDGSLSKNEKDDLSIVVLAIRREQYKLEGNLEWN